MLREIHAAKVPRFKGATALACHGDQRVETFQFEQGGKVHVLETAGDQCRTDMCGG